MKLAQIFQNYPYISLINTLDRDSTLVLIDDKMRIVEVHESEISHYPLLINKLMESQVADYFNLISGKSMIQMLDDIRYPYRKLHSFLTCSQNLLVSDTTLLSPIILHSTAECNRLISSAQWRHQLPLAFLYVFLVDREHFLGIIKVRPFQNLLPEFTSEIMLLADNRERLIGYNLNFEELADIREPGNVLGRPIDTFVNFIFPSDKRENPPRRLNPISLTTDMFRFFPKTGIVNMLQDEYGFDIQSQPRSQYIFLQSPIEHDTHDYRIRFTAERIQGTWPGLMLRTDHDIPPDGSGYFFGPEAGNRFFRFKKAGLTLSRIELPEKEHSREMTLEVEKQGNRLFIKIDEKPVFDFTEHYPYRSATDRHFAFWIDKESQCRLRAITLESADRNTPAGSDSVIAKIKGSPGMTFRVHQRLGDFRGETYQHYQLEDITVYQKRISNLEKEKQQAVAESDKMRRTLQARRTTEKLIGESTLLNRIREQLAVLSSSADILLLQGETGTGKEIVARLFHDLSAPQGAPFVKVDCGTIPPSLLEGELFGYEAGAFTGAIRPHPGRFEQANYGTLFLDEIENLTPAAQAKLLGFLDDMKVTRLGGTRTITLSLKVVTATNQQLNTLIQNGLFRNDLFYRLERFKLEIPPLRDRQDDIPLLASHFLERANSQYHKKVKRISEEGYRKLFRHSWPGNVRELQNVINRAVLFSKEETIGPEFLELVPLATEESALPTHSISSRKWKRGGVTEQALREALVQTSGNIKAAAALLCITRMTFYTYLAKFKIQPRDFKGNR